MNIPIKIAEQGGEKLNSYIRTQIELLDKRTELAELKQIIKMDMIKVHTLIGDYMPESIVEDTHYMSRPLPYHIERKRDLDYRARNIIGNIESKSNKVITEIMMSEQILKDVKHLILEMKALDLEVERLKRLQELQEQGKA